MTTTRMDYNRYMRIIGEKESPISSKVYNLCDVDLSFEHMTESDFHELQKTGLTETQLEEVVMTMCRFLWKEEYIRINKFEIDSMKKTENSDSYDIFGVANVCGGIINEEHIRLTVKDISDISSKPKILKEVYIPQKKNCWESFSKFFEQQEGNL